MKILHIGQMIGGLDIYIRNSIIYNKVEGYEYIIACGKDDKHQPIIRNGVEVKEYPISLFRSLNPVNDLKALREAVKIIRKEKPEVIHCEKKSKRCYCQHVETKGFLNSLMLCSWISLC